VSKPKEPRQVSIMFTDNSTRDFIIRANSVEQAENLFDLIYNTMEQSITDILRQYGVRKMTSVWCEYHIDEDIGMSEEE
jgi:phage terminase large subunit-like protein|tara:strand:- start:576 stop:812 length:237 start_codon:yes stop_codon:yes gene_type:complete